MQESRQYKVRELVESVRTMFPVGLCHNKEKKVVYLKQTKGEDGKFVDRLTEVMCTLVISGDQAKGEESKFVNFGLSLEKAKIFKEAGIDLGNKGNKPVKVRYTIEEYTDKNGVDRFIRRITNICAKNEAGEWTWLIQTKPATPTEPELVPIEIDEDDLPF